MIEKLDPIKHTDNLYDKNGFITNVACGGVVISKINELVDAVNKLEAMAKNTNTVLESLVQENNFHEMQIDELQMKLEAEKCDIPDSDDAIQEVIHEEPADPYAEQRKWIGKVCKFWDNLDNTYSLALLVKIIEKEPMPFEDYRGNQWYHCEPVKPDDSIIFKGE